MFKMPLFPPSNEDDHYFSMHDETTQWSRSAIKPFVLEDCEWLTVEHYYQAMRFTNSNYQEKIRQAKTVETAIKLGKTIFKKKRPDWKKIETTIMTRALYTQCQIYPEMREALVNTGEQRLVENSQFDYFWGCGRVRRGNNHYGNILMNIRNKLKEECN